MNPEEMKARTRRLALGVLRFVDGLPRTRTADVIGRQLLRCGTSVGANYRAACRARSQADFIAKMGVVEEEADETSYWLQLLIDAGLAAPPEIADLEQEANEILAITVASIRTARGSSR